MDINLIVRSIELEDIFPIVISSKKGLGEEKDGGKNIQKEDISKDEMSLQVKIADFKLRRVLKDMIEMESQIDAELANENISPEREIQLGDAKKIIRDNIARIRMDGIL